MISLLSVSPLAHRNFIWSFARRAGRWPNRGEWRFIILGRWAGF